jgi:hypothetical protein
VRGGYVLVEKDIETEGLCQSGIIKQAVGMVTED